MPLDPTGALPQTPVKGSRSVARHEHHEAFRFFFRYDGSRLPVLGQFPGVEAQWHFPVKLRSYERQTRMRGCGQHTILVDGVKTHTELVDEA